MESLLIVIEELERERDRLLEEKDKNVLKIEAYNRKIENYSVLLSCAQANSSVINAQMTMRKTTYDRINDFSGSGTNVFLKGQFQNLNENFNQSKRRERQILGCMNYYESMRDNLSLENTGIDERIEEIDLELGAKRSELNGEVKPKVYLLERGKMND